MLWKGKKISFMILSAQLSWKSLSIIGAQRDIALNISGKRKSLQLSFTECISLYELRGFSVCLPKHFLIFNSVIKRKRNSALFTFALENVLSRFRREFQWVKRNEKEMKKGEKEIIIIVSCNPLLYVHNCMRRRERGKNHLTFAWKETFRAFD
jgi:hypothetical protein